MKKLVLFTIAAFALLFLNGHLQKDTAIEKADASRIDKELADAARIENKSKVGNDVAVLSNGCWVVAIGNVVKRDVAITDILSRSVAKIDERGVNQTAKVDEHVTTAKIDERGVNQTAKVDEHVTTAKIDERGCRDINRTDTCLHLGGQQTCEKTEEKTENCMSTTRAIAVHKDNPVNVCMASEGKAEVVWSKYVAPICDGG